MKRRRERDITREERRKDEIKEISIKPQSI